MDYAQQEKELLDKLKTVQKEKEKDDEKKRKKENLQKFLNRRKDFMIGKAHCDIDFIEARYSSDTEKSTMPYGVSIAGNMGFTYTGKAPITESTKVYLHNTFTDKNRGEFEEQLLKLVQKFIDKNCGNLESVLEMMGLQSVDYHTRNYFLEEDKKVIEIELQKARKEILDKYSDKDFTNVRELYHSSKILFDYIRQNRPHLLDKIPPIIRFQ